MKNVVVKTLTEIAQRETELAILNGNYSWAILCALIEAWLIEVSSAM